MGKTGQIVVGALMFAGGIAVGIFTGQWGVALAISTQGLGLIYNAVQGTRQLAERQGAILENRANAKAGLPVVYGKTRVGPILADVRVDTSSQENKRLVVVCSFAHGSDDGTGIQAFDEIYLDDRLAWNGAIQAPFNEAIDDSGDPYQNGHLRVWTHLGTDSDVVDPRLNAMFGTAWPSTSKGLGVAYIVLLMWYNEEVYGSRLPRINVVMRGQKVFDPRTSLVAYSTNVALAIRDYLTAGVYGYGDDGAVIDDVSFESGADYCDEIVYPFSTGGGGQKRFELGGWLDTGRSTRANLADLCTACRGTVINVGGVWKLIIRREQSATGLVLTTDNVVEGSWKYVIPGAADVANRVIVNYIDVDRGYGVDSVQWPEPGMSNPYLDEDNGQLHEISLDLPFTNDRLRAQQIGMVVLRESREGIAVLVQAKEEMFQAEVGDIVDIDHPSPGWSGKPFWAVATNFQPHAGVIDMVLAEYEPSVYVLDEQFPQPTIVDTDLPDPFTVAPPTSLVLTANNTVALLQPNGDRIGRIKVAWVLADDPFIHHYEIEAKRYSDTAWDAWGPADKHAIEFFIVPVNVGETWDVRIFSVNNLGRRSTIVSDTIAVTSDVGGPLVRAVVPDISAEGDVSINVKVAYALSARYAYSLLNDITRADVQVADAENVDAEGNLQTLLRNIGEGEVLYIAVLAYESSDGAGTESTDLYRVRSNARETIIYGDVDVEDGFSAARNAAAPENGTVVLTAEGARAYSHLEDANSNLTTYRATVTVDWNKFGTLSFLAIITLWYSDDAASGTWIWASSDGGDSAVSGSEVLELLATAILDAGYDLMVELTYSNPGVDDGKSEVIVHGEDSTPAGVQYKKKGVRVSSSRIVLPVGANLWQVE